MIPRPVRYRARRPPDGPPVVEFQQSEGDRWFPLATIGEDLPFGWGPEAHVEHVRHLAAALLLSRVSLGEAGELVDDMATLVERMPEAGWEMTGQQLGTVAARLVLGKPVPDPAFPLDIAEQRLAALFGTPTCSCGWRYKLNGGTFECLNSNCPVGETNTPYALDRDGFGITPREQGGDEHNPFAVSQEPLVWERCQIEGSGANARAWREGEAEPGGWTRLQTCLCGSPLPHHLAELGLTAHVCRCHRRYKVVNGGFVPDGTEFNPFAGVVR